MIILIPSFILLCSIYINLMNLQKKSLEYIDTFAEQLFSDQIQNSKIHNSALAIQLNQQVQKISWQMNIVSEYMQAILNGDVQQNTQYVPTYHNMERSYVNQENPILLKLFRKNPLLTSTWYHINKTKIEEFDDKQMIQINKAISTDPIVRAIKFQSINTKTRQFSLNDIFFSHQYDGLLYSGSFNSTFKTQSPLPNCPYFGINKIDVRCRYFYNPAANNISIIVYEPQTFFSQGNKTLVSAFCKRILKYQSKNPDSPSELYSVFCNTLKLSIIPQYFKNFGSSSKYQIFLDPRKLTVVYHSQNELSFNRVSTIQEFETQYLQDQTQAAKFIDNVSSFQKYVLQSADRLNNLEVGTDLTRKTFEYKRNGTDCLVIINVVTMVDKMPRYEYLKSENASARYQIKGTFLFLDVLSKEIMTQYSNDLQQKILMYNYYFKYISLGLCIFMLGFQIYYSYVLGKNLMHPVIHLTKLLKSIRFQTENSQDFQQFDDNLKSDRMIKTKMKNISEVPKNKNYFIQFDENLENINLDGICFSSDTQVLLNSFQNLFKILRFTTQNFYCENNTVSLLNLNIQIQHFDQFGNHRALGVCHNNIGVIHYNSGRYNEAIESFQKAVIQAKYELNMYSHDISDSSYQFYNINKNSAFNLQNTVIQNVNSLESVHYKYGTVSNLVRIKNKSNFQNRDEENNNLLSQVNLDQQQLYWNLYNRNLNYIKALESYLSLTDNKNNNIWDIFQDIIIENAFISKHYLPQSNKREMYDCYVMLMASFKQNLLNEASYHLKKFSNLYLKNFQQKSLNSSYLTQTINNFSKNNLYESNNIHNPSYFNQHSKDNYASELFHQKNKNQSIINDLQQEEQLLNSENIGASQIITPLNIPKIRNKNKSNFIDQYHTLFNNTNITNNNNNNNKKQLQIQNNYDNSLKPNNSQRVKTLTKITKAYIHQILKDKIQSHNQNIKEKIYYNVRNIEKTGKLAQYEFSSDIYFQYYALQYAQFQINLQNYLKASLILTNALEKCYYYLPHLKLQILSKLSSILTSQQIYSPELDELKNTYFQAHSLNQSVCVIYSCSTTHSLAKTFQINSDILNEILFKNNDCFGVLKYSFKEGIYLQQMGLTNKQTIKYAPQFFENILMPNFLKNNNFSLDRNEKSKIQKQKRQTHQFNYIFSNSHKLTNIQNSTFFNKSFMVEQQQKSQEQSNLQQSDKLGFQNENNVIEFLSGVINDDKEQEIKHQYLSSDSLFFDTQLSNNDEINQSSDNKQKYDVKTNYNFNLKQKQNKQNFDSTEGTPLQSQIKISNFKINKYLQSNQILLDQESFQDKSRNNQRDYLFSNDETQRQYISSPIFSSNILMKQQLQESQEQNSSFISHLKPKSKLQDIKKQGLYQTTLKQKQEFFQNKLQEISQQNKNIKPEPFPSSFLQTNSFSQLNEENKNVILSQGQDNDKRGFNPTQSIPIYQKQNEDFNNISFESTKEEKDKRNGEEIFHQGIHAALKYFILNSDEKISCYLSRNKFKQSKSQQIFSHKSQKTFLVYITDQKLRLKNKFLIKELSEMLWNLDLELLVLVLNLNQVQEEFSSLQNIFLKKKCVITFFQSEEKMLQYMYNMREHLKNNILPMIVEHF